MNRKDVDDFGNGTVMMGFMASHKHVRIDLMQNCDLPPPSKVFIGSEKAVVSSLNKIRSRNVLRYYKDDRDSRDFDMRGESGRLEDDKPDALIREAEKKVASLTLERDRLSQLFIAEATNGFAHRLQLRLLQLQVSKLRTELQQRQKTSNCNCGEPLKEDDDSHKELEQKTNLTWMAAVALCWGLACVGISLGCRYPVV